MTNQDPGSGGADSPEKRMKRRWRRIAVSVLLFGFPTGAVYGFRYFVLDPILMRFEDRPYTVAAVLEEVPKEPAFYIFVGAIVGAILVWRWWMLVHVRDDLGRKKARSDKNSLTELDWEVAEGFRKRALALRTRADLLLGIGAAVLFAGIYFILFIVPEVAGTDLRRIATARFVALFANRLLITYGVPWKGTVPQRVRIPPGKLSLQPVAIGADDGGNDIVRSTSVERVA